MKKRSLMIRKLTRSGATCYRHQGIKYHPGIWSEWVKDFVNKLSNKQVREADLRYCEVHHFDLECHVFIGLEDNQFFEIKDDA